MYISIIDKDKCTGCGECIDTCPSGVYELVEGRSEPVNMDECIGCEGCVEVCEYFAITIEERVKTAS